ncbi:MAG: type I DNA topoisomerase [Campylobacterales bacterium]
MSAQNSAKKLIIVESPAKARTINNFLGSEYDVVASKGHMIDLPEKSFGIKIVDGKFEPIYQVMPDHSAIAKEIQQKAQKADEIYIATDEDREGEAIGWHIASLLNIPAENSRRIVFHEITKNAIAEALKHPRAIDMRRVNAQQARRLLDRIVGYQLSPLLSSKIQRGLSAGRVQSAALKIVVDREREINAFVPVEYYTIDAMFNETIEATLIEWQGKKIEKMTIASGEEARAIVEALIGQSFLVDKIETKKRSSASPEPFMTSSLQQAASSQLGFSPAQTMQIAQKLYEGVQTPNGQSGVITYMRTDSLNLAEEAVAAAREAILERFGPSYLPAKPKKYKTKHQGAQEAHEAIRPTMVDFTPAIAKNYLSSDELKLYTLIYNRFLACQMEDALFETVNLFITGGGATFKASGRKLLFDGYYKVLGSDDKDKLLPETSQGEMMILSKLEANQHFTEPPSRFSEASLIKQLEQAGIGRPSTYAPTIQTLVSRKYIEIEKKQIKPTPIAFKVIELMENHFPEIVESNFTASMEEHLDEISEGKLDWQQLLREFYEPFIAKVKEGKKKIASLKVAEPIGESCPECGGELVKREGRFGLFIACSNYPKCRYSRNIKPESENEDPEAQTTDEVCEKCGKPMVIKQGRRGAFLACSGYPDCKNTRPLEKPKSATVPCPLCGGKIIERQSKRGSFWGCANYPQCTFIAKYEPTDHRCSQCGSLMGKRMFRKKEIYECLNDQCKYREEMGAS